MVSDTYVVRFAVLINTKLRERFNNASSAKSSEGFIQVVTAAVSSLLTGTSGAYAVSASMILPGTNAIIP
ncbi:MAG: hypothetical protein QF619_07885 [Candidatus Binatia bacterium]|nr:hypothetical protein [Candidatus Binatia bacterium]